MSQVLWKPLEKDMLNSHMSLFMQAVSQHFNVCLTSYTELHNWACDNSAEFWGYFLSYSDMIVSGNYTRVMSKKTMPGVRWFEGIQLNYAENCLHYRDTNTAIINCDESGEINRTSYSELYDKVSRCAQFLKEKGIKKGDCVAAIVTNCEETIVFFSCSCITWWSLDFGIS